MIIIMKVYNIDIFHLYHTESEKRFGTPTRIVAFMPTIVLKALSTASNFGCPINSRGTCSKSNATGYHKCNYLHNPYKIIKDCHLMLPRQQ